MRRLALFATLLAPLACSRSAGSLGDDTSTGDEGTQTQTSASADTSTTANDSDSETETGETQPEDTCPASPELDNLQATIDDWSDVLDYPEVADWDLECTVAAHEGELATGETITLDCLDEQGQSVAHVIELQAMVADAEQPTQVPVTVGEALRLTLWARVWFSGGTSWALRSATEPDDLRLLYYSTIELLEPQNTDFSPLPSFVEPLTISVEEIPCELYCPPDNGGTFVPVTECDCQREQALRFAVGDADAKIQNQSAGTVGASVYAFVSTAWVRPHSNECSDAAGAWYEFLVVAR